MYLSLRMGGGAEWWSGGVMEWWSGGVVETLIGFVPEGRYEGSDSTELAEVLARSAWGNAKMAPVP
jgi:hypothetical protein